jgi:hypothetical protein
MTTKEQITDYNAFFKIIKKEQIYTIETFVEILLKFSKYIFDVSFLKNIEYIEQIIFKDKDSLVLFEIKDNIDVVINYYDNIDDTIKKQNLDVNRLYYSYIYTGIMVLYQYYYIINGIYKIKRTSPEKINRRVRSLTSLRSNQSLSLLRSFGLSRPKSQRSLKTVIILDKYLIFNSFIDKEIKNKSEFIKSDEYGNFQLLYHIILNKFNKKMLNIDNDVDISVFYPLPQETIDHLMKNTNDKFINMLKKYLLKNVESSIKITINSKNFITIPQYNGICWFISFLTGICYSDKSKELLIEKRKTYNSNLTLNKTENERLLLSFVYYVIDNITSIFKTYSDNAIENNCDIFKKFKNAPFLFIKNYIKDKKKSYIIDYNYVSNYGNPHNYVNTILRLTYARDDQLTIDKELFGITGGDFSVLYLFYKILNIKCLFIYDIDGKYYKSKFINDDVYYDTIPDVIMINKPEITYCNKIKKNCDLYEFNVEYDSENDMSFNEMKYVLDYMLHNTDLKISCNHCNHCVSGIHYNKKQYYYNSGYSVSDILCDEDKIRIPCSLIKQEWKKISKTDGCYSLKKCGYDNKIIDEPDDDAFKIILNTSKDNMCYRNDYNVIYCYVRQKLT